MLSADPEEVRPEPSAGCGGAVDNRVRECRRTEGQTTTPGTGPGAHAPGTGPLSGGSRHHDPDRVDGLAPAQIVGRCGEVASLPSQVFGDRRIVHLDHQLRTTQRLDPAQAGQACAHDLRPGPGQDPHVVGTSETQRVLESLERSGQRVHGLVLTGKRFDRHAPTLRRRHDRPRVHLEDELRSDPLGKACSGRQERLPLG